MVMPLYPTGGACLSLNRHAKLGVESLAGDLHSSRRARVLAAFALHKSMV